MIPPKALDAILASAVREWHARHETEVEQAVLRWLPYSYGTHEFTIERYPHQTVVRFRGLRHSVPHPTLNVWPTRFDLPSDRQHIDKSGDGADL
jgi:hypothetical protein